MLIFPLYAKTKRYSIYVYIILIKKYTTYYEPVESRRI